MKLLKWLTVSTISDFNYINYAYAGAIIGDGDRKSWDPRGPMIWDNFSIFRTNCAILTSYIHALVDVSRVDVFTLRDQILRIDQLRYIKIQPHTTNLSTRLWGVNTEFVGFIPQNLVLRSIV